MIQHGPGGTAIVGEKYESYEFTISGAQSNYNLKTQQTAFAILTRAAAQHVIIRCDTDMTVKFNATGGQATTVEAGIPLTVDGLLVTNMFFTTTGDTTVKVLMS